MNLKNLNFDNFKANTNEGKLLVAAISILTQNEFKTGDKVINGSMKTPHEVFEIVKKLAIEIYDNNQ